MNREFLVFRNSLSLKRERGKKIFPIFKRYCCVLQKDEKDCGSACILTIAKQYNSNFSIAKLRQILGTDKNGTNLAGMIKGLDYLGFDSKAVKVEDKKIDNSVSFPIIAHIQTTNNFLHYVVVHDLYLF